MCPRAFLHNDERFRDDLDVYERLCCNFGQRRLVA